MSTSRTLIVLAISFAATLIAIPVWLFSYILVLAGLGANVNTASIYIYSRIIVMLAMPLGLVVALIFGPDLLRLTSRRIRLKEILVYMTILFWTSYGMLYLLSEVSFPTQRFPIEYLQYYVFGVFLLPPIYFGCLAFMAIAHRPTDDLIAID